MTINVERDPEGYLINPEAWTEDIANALAKEEGVELTESHWQILRFIREYYAKDRVVPDVRHVEAFLLDENKLDKKAAKKVIFDLFPYGYVKQACKISGMKKPRAWSTG